MTLTLDLPPYLEAALLADAAATGRDAAAVAVDRLAATYAVAADYEVGDDPGAAADQTVDEWLATLPPDERAAEIALIQRGLDDFDAGRVRPAEEVYARIRARYAHLNPASRP